MHFKRSKIAIENCGQNLKYQINRFQFIRDHTMHFEFYFNANLNQN
jgi:hypothetical protein